MSLPARKTTDLIEVASQTEQIKHLGQTLIASGLLPDAIRRPEAAMLIMIKGREIGMDPVYALSHISIIKGKPAMTAEAMLGLVLASGHVIRVIETTSERCIIEGVRANDRAHKTTIEWTMDDARRAGLTGGNGPWKTYPRAMLRSRAVSELCRAMFADVLSGVSYVPEELGADVTEDGEVITEPSPLKPLPSQAEDHAAGLTPAQRRNAEGIIHEELLETIRHLVGRMPEEARPNSEKVEVFASRNLENARRTLAKLRKDLQDSEERRESTEPTGASEEARDIEDAEVVRGSDDPDDYEITDEDIQAIEGSG